MTEKIRTRCLWAGGKDYMIRYHDEEWGQPVHDDNLHFEMLILEGAQAGLSWDTILRKRENYRALFANFDPVMVARFDEKKQQELLQNPGIVRNRLKVASAVRNAKAFLQIQKEFGSFDSYIWGFVDGKPILNHFLEMKDFPALSPLSDAISKDLKKRGMNFVGSTIIYAYMQAVGLTNDHTVDCFCHPDNQ